MGGIGLRDLALARVANLGPGQLRRLVDLTCGLFAIALFLRIGDAEILLQALWLTVALGAFVYGLRAALARIAVAAAVMVGYLVASDGGRPATDRGAARVHRVAADGRHRRDRGRPGRPGLDLRASLRVPLPAGERAAGHRPRGRTRTPGPRSPRRRRPDADGRDPDARRGRHGLARPIAPTSPRVGRGSTARARVGAPRRSPKPARSRRSCAPTRVHEIGPRGGPANLARSAGVPVESCVSIAACCRPACSSPSWRSTSTGSSRRRSATRRATATHSTIWIGGPRDRPTRSGSWSATTASASTSPRRERGLGLDGMQERAQHPWAGRRGPLAPGDGTRVEIVVSRSAPEAAARDAASSGRGAVSRDDGTAASRGDPPAASAIGRRIAGIDPGRSRRRPPPHPRGSATRPPGRVRFRDRRRGRRSRHGDRPRRCAAARRPRARPDVSRRRRPPAAA